MILGRCHVCGGDVESMHPVAYRIVGWEVIRAGGGANRIVGRERLRDGTIIAHARCAEQRARDRRRGIADEQEAMQL